MQDRQPQVPVSLANHLTLVVLTHNRPYYLRRTLRYYSDLACSLIVVDTSAQPASEVRAQFPAVAYHHAPPLAGQCDGEKLRQAVEHVTTPYMALVPDSDFLLFDGLAQSLAFLEQNAEYGLCHGYTLMQSPVGAQTKYYVRDRKGPEDCSQATAAERLGAFAEHFIPTLHAVCRTELVRSWSAAAATLGGDGLELAHGLFMLGKARARLLPVAFRVAELDRSQTQPYGALGERLAGQDGAAEPVRELCVAALADLPEAFEEDARSSRVELLERTLDGIAQCLREQRSMAFREILRCNWSASHLRPEWHFQPTQFVALPFYTTAFFDALEAIEWRVQFQPCSPLQRKQLESTLLAQAELLARLPFIPADQLQAQLFDSLDAYPFNAQLVAALEQCLVSAGLSEQAQRYAQWRQRLQGADDVFGNSQSGRLHAVLHEQGASSPEQQLQALQDAGGGPLLRIVLLDLDGDIERLQVSLDSLFEGHYKRFRLVVLTTVQPPVATSLHDRVHFLQVQESSWHQLLMQLLEATEWNWVMLARSGVQFAPNGLLQVAHDLQQVSGCRAVYGDELQKLADGTLDSWLRPSFNLDLLLSQPRMMAGHWLIERDAFFQVGGYSGQFPQAVEFDLIMRLIEQGGMQGIGHIDTPLLTAQPDEVEFNRDEIGVLRRHLVNRGFNNAVVLQSRPRVYHLRYGHAERPLVSILIPTKDQLPMVQRCVETLLERTRYSNYEILLVDNQSETPEALQWLQGLESMANPKLRVLRYPHPFNYSAINNLAAEQARGEYLVLLNNDTAITEGDWLDELLNHAQRPEVGIVGARLLHADGTLQHAGVVLGLRGPAEHPFIGSQPTASSYMNRTHCDQNYSAVTAACLMIRTSLYKAVGGLDEVAFKVSYNDVDLCLKVGALGYLVVWTPHATLLHEGSVSQRQVDPATQAQKQQRFLAEQRAMCDKWQALIDADPAYSRHLSRHGRGFTVAGAAAVR